jgi:hypothetical protein
MSLTIFLASFEASRGPLGDEGSVGEVFEILEKVDCNGREVLSGREDINGARPAYGRWTVLGRYS